MIRIADEVIQPFEEEHIAVIRQVAPECTLFLKKDDMLPLAEPCPVALYGCGARKTIKGGTGSGDVNVRHFVSVEEGLEKAGFHITSGRWLDTYDELIKSSRGEFVKQVKKEAKELGANPVMYGLGKSMPQPEYRIPLEGDGELAVYVLSRISGEGADRVNIPGDINLSKTEIRDILTLNERFDKFLLVLNVGGMVNLEPVKIVKNILLLGQLGSPTGDVLADIILGKSYPSGKLAMTWAPIENYPSTIGFGDMDDTYYKEGIYVGYRYFDSVRLQPTFPFGFGLSYTDFTIRLLETAADEKQVTVIAEVVNIGVYPGKEVVQLYYSSPHGILDKPYQELGAFVKTRELQPGESEILTLSFETADMTSYAEDMAAYIMEVGDYVIRIGNSSRDTRVCCVVRLDETTLIRKVKHICPGCTFEDLILQEKQQEDWSELPVAIHKIVGHKLIREIVSYDNDREAIQNTGSCTWQDVKNGRKSLDNLIGSLCDKQLAYLSVGLFEDNGRVGSIIGSSARSVAGAAGETSKQLEQLGVPTLVMADGPAGLRLCTKYKVVGGHIKGIDNSLDNFLEYLEPEQLQQMERMMSQISEEELAAPLNYMYCIAIPIGTALAQSFSEQVCKNCGDIVGDEMERFGIHLWLAPAINIQRSPLCGRNFEYFSEDPLVSGLLAAAVTEGVQSHKGCGVTVKHFALNNQETNRIVSNSMASERGIREIYLRAFEICVKKAQPHAIMSSYNLVNGVNTCNNKDILTNVLRNEWGFEGIVMTDWYTASSMLTDASQRRNKHTTGTPAGCIYAGNDLVMPGMQDDLDDIMKALTDEQHRYPITRIDLQVTAKRVLEMIFMLSI